MSRKLKRVLSVCLLLLAAFVGACHKYGLPAELEIPCALGAIGSEKRFFIKATAWEKSHNTHGMAKPERRGCGPDGPGNKGANLDSRRPHGNANKFCLNGF